ncbi:hypothetical protein Patl1_23757 [Pistacia atlantica]|uniref:Uncharacterized protein n=1 Tax=Pistacia atlantica TaxID=434234 RepID=A0ACC1A0Z6_9ROSI|nr:hypothetical protein Patl1_23757 [Pistacia atlantica]
MKTIALNGDNRIEIKFNDKGQPIDEESVKLSSFLGPLGREIARYKLDQEWQKHYVLKEMGALWRTSKSRLVSNIKMAKNEDERMALKPDNIKSISEWKKFVEQKLGPRFKGKSEEMKNRRKKQTYYKGGRRGYARMTEDIKKKTGKQVVSRVEVWIEAHKKKNGEPINTKTAEAIENLQQMGNDSSLPTPTNLREDVITKILGLDKGGHVRGLGRGIVKTIPHKTKCKLLDWSGSTEVVAEGPKVPNAFLWRSAFEMVFVEDAIGSTVAWPSDKVVLPFQKQF